MTKDKVHINNFVKHIFDENFAEAKSEIQTAVAEKIKLRMKEELQKDLTKENK